MKQLQQIDPKTLRFNNWNPNHVSAINQDKLVESIKRHGCFKPIIAREIDDDVLEVIGGQHRALASIEAGLDEVPLLNLGKITDTQAKEISLLDNHSFGSDDPIQLGQVINDILADDIDIQEFMPYETEDLSLIFAASDVDLDNLDLDEDDETTPPNDENTPTKKIQTHQILRFRISVEDDELVNEVINKVMKEHGYDKADSLTNAGDALLHILNDYKEM